VLGLKELFEKFAIMMFESCKVDITKYMTASHMAYEIWQSMLEHEVEIPNNLENITLLRKQHMVEDVILNKKYSYRTNGIVILN